MKTNKYELTVAGRSARFIVRKGECFNDALSRGASKLGYYGGAWAQPNFHMHGLVTVTDRMMNGNSRAAYNGQCSQVGI